MNKKTGQIPIGTIESKIYLIRGQRMILDMDLANIYQVQTGQLIQAVKRNFSRFPIDFMFQLTIQEVRDLKSQIVISSSQHVENIQDIPVQKNQADGYGGRRKLPHAFTEQGVSMLSAVLNSPRAVAASIEIIRTFVRLRQLLASNVELSSRLVELEKKYDQKFSVVFEVIRQLMNPPQPILPKKGRLGL